MTTAIDRIHQILCYGEKHGYEKKKKKMEKKMRRILSPEKQNKTKSTK